MRERCLLLALLLGSAACGGSDGEAATPSTTEAPPATGTSTTTTTAEVDPFTVPDDPADIDEAYVEAVANELYRVNGDATRLQMDGGDVQEVVARYEAIYDPLVVDAVLTGAFEYAAEGFPNSKTPRGDAKISVESIISVGLTCIAARATQDVSDVVNNPPPPTEGILILRSHDPESDPMNFNSTPWVLERLQPASTNDEDPCA